jgi:tetratricopeptide (TPR) repeat protein
MVLGLGLWAVYLATLSPAFPPDDSPETIAAAVTLGIQHPPGYPLPALVGRCADLALPLGGPAWRINLLSALLGVTVALLGAALAWRLAGALEHAPRSARRANAEPGARGAAALFTGLSLGLGATLWQQATEAKGGIYLLNLALGLGLWHAALDAWNGSRRATAAFGLLAGLMLAGHFLSAALWMGPLGSALAWGVWGGRVRGWGIAAALALPGLALYLYLPLRAAQWPLLDTGHPCTWSQFFWVLGRSGYSQAGLGPAGDIAADQLGLWWSRLWTGWAWGLPLIAAVGAAALWQRQRGIAMALAVTAFLGVWAGAVHNQTPADNRWLCLIFTLPGTVLLAPLGGLGLVAVAQGWRRSGVRTPAWPAWSLALALPLGAAALNGGAQNRSGDYVAWDFGHDLCLGLPRGALYLAEGDYHTLPLLYVQAVEGRRLDVLTGLNALCGEPWYQALLQRRDPGLLMPAAGAPADAAPALARLNAGRRPVAVGPYSQWLTPGTLAPWPLRQRGLARETGPSLAAERPDLAAAWAQRPPPRAAADLEPVEAALLPWYSVALVQDGNEAIAAGRPARALLDYRRALAQPGELPRAGVYYNCGQAAEALKDPGQAMQCYRDALGVDPSFQPATARIQALLAAQAKQEARTPAHVQAVIRQADAIAADGHHDAQALAFYGQAVVLGYASAGLWRNVGVLRLRDGQAAGAVEAFQAGLRLAPGDPTLTQYLAAAEAALHPQ